jgi:serine/threonine protein kinase
MVDLKIVAEITRNQQTTSGEEVDIFSRQNEDLTKDLESVKRASDWTFNEYASKILERFEKGDTAHLLLILVNAAEGYRYGVYFDPNGSTFIGGGASADVFLACDYKTNKLVAIKLFRNQNSHDFVQGSFLTPKQEALMMQKLYELETGFFPGPVDYQVIASAHGSKVEILVSEYLGKSDFPDSSWKPLQNEIDDFKATGASFSAQDILTISQQIAEAQNLMFRQNIINRDLTPNNIFISGSKKLKFLDYGMTQTSEELESSDGLVGTPAYNPPEQVPTLAHVRYIPYMNTFVHATLLFEFIYGKPLLEFSEQMNL